MEEVQDQEQGANDALVNEYINTIAKKYNDTSLEVVNLQARLNLATREKNQLLKKIDSKDKDIEEWKSLLHEERNKTPQVQVKEVVKEVEVEKIVEVEKEGPSADEALIRENDYLKKELFTLEKKLKKVKQRQQEIADGGGT